MKKDQIVVLLRHAVSEKNIAEQHGGMGAGLVAWAIESLQLICRLLSQDDVRIARIRSAPRVQCEETSAHLGRLLYAPVTVDSDLAPIDLGLVDGLSEAEIQERFPDATSPDVLEKPLLHCAPVGELHA